MKIADYLEAKFKRLKDEANIQKKLEAFEAKKAEEQKEIKKAGDQLQKVLQEKLLFRKTNASKLIHNSIVAFKQTYSRQNDQAQTSPFKSKKAVQFRSITPTRKAESENRRAMSTSLDIDTYFELYEQKGLDVQRQIIELHKKRNDFLLSHQSKIDANKNKAVESQEKHLDDLAARYIRKILDFDHRRIEKEQNYAKDLVSQKEKFKENKGAMHEKMHTLKAEMDDHFRQVIETRREKIERATINKEKAMRQTQQKLNQFQIKKDHHLLRSAEINEGTVQL